MSWRQQREKARRCGAEGAPVMAQDAQDDDDGYGRWRRRSSGTGRHYSGKEVRRRFVRRDGAGERGEVVDRGGATRTTRWR
jgi:hypothetical protein